MRKIKPEIRLTFGVTMMFFVIFLILPLGAIFGRSFLGEGSIGLQNYITALSSKAVKEATCNSFVISGITAFITTIMAFVLAYAVNCTNISERLKKGIELGVALPMLLPTITYGFAIIYSFGKQGLITKLVGREFFEIYGFNGLLMGYIIYTLPSAFLLINNSFRYIDKKYIVVSKLMGDSSLKSFFNTILRPLVGTIGGAYVLAFILSFTDFGIPATVGGTYNVLSMYLYQQMLGAIPDFNGGAVIAVLMLIPAIFAVILLGYLERFNFHYDKITEIEYAPNRWRDMSCGMLSVLTVVGMLAIFAVMFIAPFMKNWPYDYTFTLAYVRNTLGSSNMLLVYKNSVMIAGLTALCGTLIAYGAALMRTRTSLGEGGKKVLDAMAMMINSVPGMVLGLSYLLLFNKSSLKGTFAIIVICNMIHFFTTPYLLAKNSLSKMNPGWEITGELMGDTWLKTVIRVVIPNSIVTLIEMISYYFVNAMVTISAIIFLVSAKTGVMTSKIKELQHYAKFNDIFILSLLILLTNLVIKVGATLLQKKFLSKQIVKDVERKGEKKMDLRKLFKGALVGIMALAVGLLAVGCGNEGNGQIVIYSNADEEALAAMEKALNNAGYEGQYILQGYGTSELGGKILAEGSSIEANIITMSSYYLESAQAQQNMFADLTFETKALEEYPAYQAPILANTGAIFVNTQLLQAEGLEMPTSIKDLTSPKYEGLVAIPNIMDSSTAWLLVQAVIAEYGQEEGAKVMAELVKNCGPHLESSGSGPIKKVRAGEVAAGFGLRHQGVKDAEEGKPIAYIDPIEGNFTLTECLAVVKKNEQADTLAMAMAEAIIKGARTDLIQNYPVALYEGETVENVHKPAYSKQFEEPLTVDLLKAHQEFFKKVLEMQ